MKTKIIVISILTIVALLFSTGTAFADSQAPMNLSFQVSSGNSAGWVTGPGSSSSEAFLTINTATGFSFAVIYVHHTPAALPITEPSYSVINYASGTPRIWIYMSDGSGAFIYPTAVFGTTNVETLGFTCSSSGFVAYSTWQTCEAGTTNTVSAVYIIADTSQAVPYTAYITCFQYNSTFLIGTGC